MRIAGTALRRFGRWPYAAAWAALILAISSIPNFAPPSSPGELNVDKLAHFGLFFVLASLVFAAARRSWPGVSLAVLAVGVVIAVAAFGAIDEAYQRLIPGRDTNPFDWAADVVGAGAGVACAVMLTQKDRASRRSRGGGAPDQTSRISGG